MRLHVELNDGTEHDITIGNPSLVAYDRTRTKRQWPDAESAPMVWMTFLAWHQLTAQKIVSCKLEEFESQVCVGVEVVKRKKGKKVDPTRPTAESDSSLPSPSLSVPPAPLETPGSASLTTP